MTKTSKKKTLVGATFPKCKARLGYHYSVIRPAPLPAPPGPLQVPPPGRGLFTLHIIDFINCYRFLPWGIHKYKLYCVAEPETGSKNSKSTNRKRLVHHDSGPPRIPCIRDLVNARGWNKVIWLVGQEWDICSVQSPLHY